MHELHPNNLVMSVVVLALKQVTSVFVCMQHAAGLDWAWCPCLQFYQSGSFAGRDLPRAAAAAGRMADPLQAQPVDWGDGDKVWDAHASSAPPPPNRQADVNNILDLGVGVAGGDQSLPMSGEHSCKYLRWRMIQPAGNEQAGRLATVACALYVQGDTSPRQ